MNVKYFLHYAIAIAVLVVFNYYTLSALGQPVLPEHLREAMGNWFTGSALDWAGYAIFNAILVTWMVICIRNKSVFYNEVGSNTWNYIFAGCMAASVLLIYLG